MNTYKENLYSRQIGAIGKKTMAKLVDSKIYIIGYNSISIEVVKCLCLLGVSEIIIYIDNINKQLITLKYLKTLNKYVKIIVNTNIDIIPPVDVVIQTSLYPLAIKINTYCRKNNIKYIYSKINHLTGYIFNDFGKKHIINDINGEKIICQFIKSINVNDIDNTIEIFLLKKNKFQKDQYIKFNNQDYKHKIKFIQNNKIIIDKTNNVKLNSKFIVEVKKKHTISHKSFLETINSKLNYPDIAINCHDINILNTFHKLNNEKPKKIFPVMGSIFGAIIAGEVIKIAGKYKPLSQECLINYDYIQNIENIVDYLKNTNIFVVGCGALGCEYLKLLSMLDSCTKKGKLTVIDMDHIELSNLNRQFLFSNNDIGKSKSKIAKQKILTFNPTINIDSLNIKACEDTEDKLNSKFWRTQDIIINALDNIEARQYIDRKCVIYDKPLFESGTLGTKCNVQTIIPNITKTYSETMDPEDDSIPVCTIKNFPYKIEHCIEWSLEIFNKYFNEFVTNIKQYMKYGEKYFDNLEDYEKKLLNKYKYNDIELFCKKIYEELFLNNIKNVLKDNPMDDFWIGNKLKPKIIPNLNKYKIIKLFIDLFNKCFKNLSVEIFDKDDDNHIEIVKILANTRAEIYGINKISSLEVKLIAGKIIPALSTTTTLVTGLVFMEILNYVNNLINKKNNVYNDYYINMGINLYLKSESDKCTKIFSGMYNRVYGCKTKAIPDGFTIWNKIILDRSKNRYIGDIIDYLKQTYNLNIQMISIKNHILYSVYNEFENKLLEDLYDKNNYTELDILVVDKSGIPVVTPKIII